MASMRMTISRNRTTMIAAPAAMAVLVLLAMLTVLIAAAASPLSAQDRSNRGKEGQEQPEKREVPGKEAPASAATEDPLRVFKGIERAWQRGNADGVAAFAGEGRVFLDVRGIGQKGGYYSRSQLKYLFRDMFKADDQLKFEFVKFHNLEEPDRKVYGIAYRSCKNNRSGKVFQDKVYVTLGREGTGWVVAEIKTTR